MLLNNRKISLQDQAYVNLRKLVLSGELSYNKLYSEVYVSKLLNISRTPIRTALQRLEKDSFIVILPQRGFHLKQLNNKDIDEIFELRKAIEGYAVVSIVEKKDVSAILGIKKYITAQEEVVGLHDPMHFMEQDSKFHASIVNVTQNQRLINFYETIKDLIAYIGLQAIRQFEHYDALLAEHRAILASLENWNKADAMEAVFNHLDTGANLYKQISQNFADQFSLDNGVSVSI